MQVLRLSIQDKSRAEEAKKQAKEEYYAQFSFKPKLNKVWFIIKETFRKDPLLQADNCVFASDQFKLIHCLILHKDLDI